MEMLMSDTFSVRLPAEQTRFLDKMAKDTDRSRNKIISGAVARMMENYEYVTRLVSRASGNMSRAARLARVDRTTLYRLLERHGFRRDNSESIET